MAISRTNLIDRKANVRDSRLYIIATEGEVTEKQYFEMFKHPRVKVHVLPTQADHKSAPAHLISRLSDFKETYDIAKNDQLWLVFDVDHRKQKELDTVCRLATQKRFQLSISNPCFELWLLLHKADAIPSAGKCGEIEAQLRALMGQYNKTNIDLSQFEPGINDAIRRAKQLDTNRQSRWPADTGTHLYKLVESLIQFTSGGKTSA